MGIWFSAKRKVFKFDLKGVFIEEYESIHEAGMANNISDSSIVNCCAGKQKSAAGFIWKYKK
jgi:hypothetical protein